MFGLENQKKKGKADEFVFELENDIKGGPSGQRIREKIESRIKVIKDVLRSGQNKGEFDQFGQLLHGYTSLLKVMARLKTSQK